MHNSTSNFVFALLTRRNSKIKPLLCVSYFPPNCRNLSQILFALVFSSPPRNRFSKKNLFYSLLIDWKNVLNEIVIKY